MTLCMIGAGLSRTGTGSLKQALETLLNTRCYHMKEVMAKLSHTSIWNRAALGDLPVWSDFFEDYGATVDLPAALFWPELCEFFPDAIVLLSIRDPEDWWQSTSQTVVLAGESQRIPIEWKEMRRNLYANRWITNYHDKEAAIKAFNAHNKDVRNRVPSDRLLVWRFEDGWEPICNALGLPVPGENFPHTNTKEEWRAKFLKEK